MENGAFLNGMTMQRRIRKKSATAAIDLQADIRVARPIKVVCTCVLAKYLLKYFSNLKK